MAPAIAKITDAMAAAVAAAIVFGRLHIFYLYKNTRYFNGLPVPGGLALDREGVPVANPLATYSMR